jgi:hypothetical protein
MLRGFIAQRPCGLPGYAYAQPHMGEPTLLASLAISATSASLRRSINAIFFLMPFRDVPMTIPLLLSGSIQNRSWNLSVFTS